MSGITIKQLAQICGVAASTVSRAMNDRADVNPETRARILAAAEKHGYVPNASARSLKISAAQAVAVIIQGEMGPLFLDLLTSLETVLSDAGYGTFLSHVPDARAHASTVERLVNDGKFSGVVFLGRYGDRADVNASALSRELARINVPIVFCTTADFSDLPSQHSSVSVDDYAGSYALTQHLIELGHRKIAFGGAAAGRDTQHPWALRFSGYLSALRDAGVDVDPRLTIPSAKPEELYTMANGYESTRAWLAADPPSFTAIVASCDAAAIGIGRALHEAGLRVPEDCSVTGFDGLDMARFTTPTLTTIRQPLTEIAETTVRVLLSAISESVHSTEQIWIRGEVVVGESTGPTSG